MAEKKVPLSIILRTVDKATAGIQAFNKKLEEQLKPVRDFKKAFGELKDNLNEKYGFSKIADGFRGVGSAVGALIGKVAVIGGVAGAAVAGVLSLVDHFDALGDTAERLGTSADFLAAFRFAAERAGAPVEAVDTSLQTLVTNMGAAKAGTGKMLKFLQQISPVLAKQVTSANSLEEALGLLADAAAKLPDAARRSKLAAATLGDAALAPLLARGAPGIQELLTKYHELAGAQGEAAAAAGGTDDALKDLHASADGVKAALVTGLAPALTTIIDKLTKWFVGHRADIAKWADQIGKELPEAVERLVAWVGQAFEQVTSFVDAIGGWRVAAAGLAAVMAGPLVAAVVSFSATLVATPFGWVLMSIAAITVAIIELIKHWEEFRSISGVQDSVNKVVADPTTAFSRAFEGGRFKTSEEIDAARAARAGSALPLPSLAPSAGAQAAAVAAVQQATIKVDFMNVPKGVRVTSDPRSTADVDLGVGYQMGGF